MSTTTKLRTIIVATDFSANAGVARAWAEQLARQHDATLVLVHAFTSAPANAPEFVRLPQYCYDDIRARLTSQLNDEAAAVRSSGVTVDCELRSGTAFEVVIAAAERHGADLIVAGTRGRTVFKGLLLGSTAARLISNARCPVLTVHPADAGPPRPVRTVLIPTDFSEDAALATEAATRVLGAPSANRRMVLLHAHYVPYEVTYLPAAVLENAISAADASAKRTIEELAAKLRHSGITIDTVTCHLEPMEAILDHARSVGADLIAMGTHGRSGLNRLIFGSVAERVVASAPCPVLTVHREAV
jgi:nucleotide-binding universal stress UspA family protein